MTNSPGRVISFTPSRHTHLIPYLAALHAACITHVRIIATFLPPLSHEKLLAWWTERIAEVVERSRFIFILVRNDADDNDDPGGDGDGYGNGEGGASPSGSDDIIRGSDVVGVVMLSIPSAETGASRAGVEKLLLHSSWRRRGGARRLMEALEREASILGKTILVSGVRS